MQYTLFITIKPSSFIIAKTSVEVLERIAKAIGCDISELFDKPERENYIVCPHCGRRIRIEKDGN